MISLLEAKEFRHGCLMGGLAAFVDNEQPLVQQAIGAAYADMTADIAAVLGEAKGLGKLPSSENVSELAGVIFDAWEGALLRARVEGPPRRPRRLCLCDLRPAHSRPGAVESSVRAPLMSSPLSKTTGRRNMDGQRRCELRLGNKEDIPPMLYETINPATGRSFRPFRQLRIANSSPALAKADALYREDWRHRAVADRARILSKAAALLLQNAEDYARTSPRTWASSYPSPYRKCISRPASSTITPSTLRHSGAETFSGLSRCRPGRAPDRRDPRHRAVELSILSGRACRRPPAYGG
ncbi:MAG: aldehyde dehydrogenase family protein [Methylovirgula sp.]